MLKNKNWGILFILFLGFLFRIYGLGKNSFWYDEAYFALGAKYVGNYPMLLKASIWPGFIILIHFWKYLGETEFILRLLPLIFGVFSIATVYKIGKELSDKKVGLASAFLVAISPLHIWYSQELSPYTALVLFSTLSLYFFVKILRGGKPHYWFGLIIFNILNVYIHPAAFLILAVEMIYFWFYQGRYKHLRKKFFFAQVLILLFFSPWLYNIAIALFKIFRLNVEAAPFYDYTLIKNYWVPRPSLTSLFWTFKNFSAGYSAPFPLSVLATGLFFALFIYGASNFKNRQNLSLILLGLLFPILFVYIVSKVIPLYVDRYFMPSSVFYYILIASGLNKIGRKPIRLIILILICSVNIFGIIAYYSGYLPGNLMKEAIGIQIRRDSLQALGYIMQNFRAGDKVVHNTENTIPTFKYYLERDYKFKQKPKQLLFYLSQYSDIPVSYEYIIDENGFKKVEIFPKEYKKVWLVLSSESLSGGKKSNKLEWFDRHYKRIEEKRFKGIIVYSYRQNI